MHYEIETEPSAGQKFSFIAHDVVKPARFEFMIDGDLVKDTQCDDPPCHEFIEIHYSAAGSVLLVRGTDESGVYIMEWEIGDTPLGTGGRRPQFIQGPVLVTK
jgi:hypothetical protein